MFLVSHYPARRPTTRWRRESQLDKEVVSEVDATKSTSESGGVLHHAGLWMEQLCTIYFATLFEICPRNVERNGVSHTKIAPFGVLR